MLDTLVWKSFHLKQNFSVMIVLIQVKKMINSECAQFANVDMDMVMVVLLSNISIAAVPKRNLFFTDQSCSSKHSYLLSIYYHH